MPQTPTLARIRIYPVKSLGGFDRDVWELDAFGLRYDRRWMIVDPDGRFMTQRDFPGMAEIAVEMQADRLILSVSMRSPIAVPLEPEPGPSEPVSIWGDTVAARAVSEDANRWLGEVLKTPCRLVYMPDESARSVNPKYVDRAAQVAFADGFPLLLTSEESLEELNRRLPEPVTMERFRPNLVVRGTSGPHAEDAWRRIRLSDMELHVVKPCARCVIVTTDQNTGERGVEPLQTLATYRSANGEVYFGQNAVHLGHGRVRVGDDVHILETGELNPDLDGEASGDSGTPAGEAEPASEPADRSAQPDTESTQPSFEIYLPESDEDLEFEPNLPAEPERKIERYIPAQPGRKKASRETGTESDAAGEPASNPVVDDIIFPFEVDLVVTPEDLKEAAMKQAAADAEAAEEETVAMDASDADSIDSAVEDDAMEAEVPAEADVEEEAAAAFAEDEEEEEALDPQAVAAETAADEVVEEELAEGGPVADEPVEDEPAQEPVTEVPGDETAKLPDAGEAAVAEEDIVEGAARDEAVPEEAEEQVIDAAVEEEALEEEPAEAEEAPEEVLDEDVEVEEPAAAKAAGKAKPTSKSRRKPAREIEFALGGRPDAAAINRLYEAAGRPEVAGDQDPGRIDRAFEASNVVVAAWLGDALVGVLRGWSDGARDGFISDLVVHPDHVGAGIGVELVHHAMDAHPGIRWVLRASVTSPYLGSALGWTHLGGGWFVSPA